MLPHSQAADELPVIEHSQRMGSLLNSALGASFHASWTVESHTLASDELETKFTADLLEAKNKLPQKTGEAVEISEEKIESRLAARRHRIQDGLHERFNYEVDYVNSDTWIATRVSLSSKTVAPLEYFSFPKSLAAVVNPLANSIEVYNDPAEVLSSSLYGHPLLLVASKLRSMEAPRIQTNDHDIEIEYALRPRGRVLLRVDKISGCPIVLEIYNGRVERAPDFRLTVTKRNKDETPLGIPQGVKVEMFRKGALLIEEIWTLKSLSVDNRTQLLMKRPKLSSKDKVYLILDGERIETTAGSLGLAQTESKPEP